MAGSLRISKSKALNFKKLSFLYLMFIVFYFFSTSGDYLHHYHPLARTQDTFNNLLEAHLNKHVPVNPEEKLMRLRAKAALKAIEKIKLLYLSQLNHNKNEKEIDRDLTFINWLRKNDDKSQYLNERLWEFASLFPLPASTKVANDLGINSANLSSINLLFRETPNAAIPSFLNHMKTVVLNHAIRFLDKEIKLENMVNIATATDSALLQGYRKVYYVGERVDFKIISRDSVPPKVDINGKDVSPIYNAKEYHISFVPQEEGNGTLTASVAGELIKHDFRVEKPQLKFLENEQEIPTYLSEPLTLTLDMIALNRIQNLRFTSASAFIERTPNGLIITPKTEGRFTVEMWSGNKLLDAHSLFCMKGKSPEVILKDIAGQKAELSNAHCLESESPYWQVINFNVVYISPGGSVTEYKSNSRFLRAEIHALEKNAKPGTTLIFKNIRLLNMNGVSTAIAAPLYIGL